MGSSASFGWFAYAPLAPRAATAPDPITGEGQPGRPELADVGRLARRGLRSIVRTARADLAPTLARRLRAHLGEVASDVAVVEESWRGYDHVNVQAGLDAWLAEPGRQHEVVGITGFQHREFGLADVLSGAGPGDPYGPRPGNVATVNAACGPRGEVRACVACALYLITDGVRLSALLLRGPELNGAHDGVTLQVVSTEPGASAAIAARVRELTLTHNVFRGQVLSFGSEVFGPGQTLAHFHPRPALDRSDLVLPDGVLDAVERQVIGVARHRGRLLASGQHLKRGLLLYGPPGTGKTHTVRYLLSCTPGVTVVQLTGSALHLIAEACSVARALEPAMVVIEDVDLIAEDRGAFPGQHPLLFQLLNEMDGLTESADVVFVLTTNRADLLEPALAARPGRVDQAIELGLPDLTARRALLELYRSSLDLDVDYLDRVAERTAGVTASFLKELLRRAAVLAAEADRGPHGPTDDDEHASEAPTPVTVTADQLDSALAELQATRNAMTRIVLGSASPT
ncbi:AAA family ATPase [Pengzhenrongella frigida]|uniref:26S protease regulatory subunit n=1 Tax=Pengzhenrongella frigida TaxID=1259133 RepID=A0A4Q5MVJ5_9MICO|nr:ATP-binding protein [Cellulomonas sp. HLT2-17]RYV49525.1 26S protease regulatory subunit [Cellulomonas sp. HLT2-17]